MEKPHYLLESIVVDSSKTEDSVEVVPQVRADLLFALTRKVTIWVDLE